MHLRTDDFRCHDERLVEVLAGREIEAVAFAEELRSQGLCDGLFVQGNEIVDWNFLANAAPFDSLEFIRVDRSFCSVDFSLLKNVRFLRIGDVRCRFDFSGFSRMEKLECEWGDGCSGMDALGALSDITISGLGSLKSAFTLLLPRSVRKLSVIGYRHPELTLGNADHDFESMGILYARSLQCMPYVKSVDYLDIKNVGRTSFAYATIPAGVRGLNIDSCAPITSWDFLEPMVELEYLHVYGTKCPELPSVLKTRLAALRSIVLPRSSGFTNRE